MRIRPLLAPLVFALAVLAGCGSSVTPSASASASGSSSPRSAGAANADFISRGNAICAKAATDSGVITQPQLSGSLTNPTTADLPALSAYLTSILVAGHAEYSKLAGLGQPPANPDLWSRALTAAHAEVTDVEAVQTASQAGDVVGYLAAARKATTDGQTSDQLMTQFGMTTCGGGGSAPPASPSPT